MLWCELPLGDSVFQQLRDDRRMGGSRSLEKNQIVARWLKLQLIRSPDPEPPSRTGYQGSAAGLCAHIVPASSSRSPASIAGSASLCALVNMVMIRRTDVENLVPRTDRDEVDEHRAWAPSENRTLRDALIECDQRVIQGCDPMPVRHIENKRSRPSSGTESRGQPHSQCTANLPR